MCPALIERKALYLPYLPPHMWFRAFPATSGSGWGSGQSTSLPFKVHEVLCLPRSLHFKVHKVPRLPQKLHFEVHKVLCLPRNLHFEVHGSPSAAPATKSALRGSQSGAPATKSTVRATKSALRGSQSAVSATKPDRRAAPATKSALRSSQSAAPATKSALHGSQSTAPATKNEPHVQKSRFTAPVAKSESLEDHRHVQSAAPATKSALRSKAALIPCTLHLSRKVDFGPPKHEVSLPPATKSDHHVRKCARHHNESAVTTSTTAATQILRACTVEMHFEDFKRRECTVHSSELAGHGCATPTIRHRCLTTTLTPIYTLFGEQLSKRKKHSSVSMFLFWGANTYMIREL